MKKANFTQRHASVLLKWAVALLLPLFVTQQSQAQYATTVCGNAFIDISATGTFLGALSQGDDNAIALPVGGTGLPAGFAFLYYNAPVTTVTATTNGFISFNGGLAGAPFGNAALVAGNRGLFPLWDDFNLGAGMWSQTMGTAPNRTFIVQWNKALFGGVATDIGIWQVQISETSNLVRFIYQDVIFAAASLNNNGGSATIGVAGPLPAACNPVSQYSLNQATILNATPPGVFAANVGCLLFTPPSACTLAPSASITVGTVVNTCVAAPATINIPALVGTCLPGGTIQYTVDGGAVQTVPAGATTITVSNLTPGVHNILWSYVVAGCPGATVTQTITVADTQDPVITCPANIVTTLGPGDCSTFINYNVTLTDNCPFAGPGGTLATITTGGNGNAVGGMVWFDINNLTAGPITITKFGMNITAGTMVNVYRKAGTFAGFQTNVAAWGAPVASANATVGPFSGPFPGNGTITPALMATGFVIPPGVSGIALHTLTAASNYTNGNGANQNYTDGTISLFLGSTANTPFGAPFTPRVFNGSVSYQLPAVTAEADQTAGLPSGSAFPIGTTTNCFLGLDLAGNDATCCFDVTVNEFPNPTNTLACNDLVQISLDETCAATLGADQILEGGPYGCYDNYIVMVLSNLGANLGSTVYGYLPNPTGINFIGNQWTVKVTDPATGNSCWGAILVEDKLPPTIECRDLVVDCTDYFDSNGDGLPDLNLPAEPAPALVGPQAIIYEGLFDPLDADPLGTNPLQSYDFDYNYIPAGTPVLDVDVHFKILDHTWVGDLQVEVIAPDGTLQPAFGAPGCAGPWTVDVVLDDEGTAITLCADLNANGGHIQPLTFAGAAGSLTPLDGHDAHGIWTVNVRDVFLGCGGGHLEKIGLEVTVNAPQIVPADNCGPVTLTHVDNFTDGACNGPSGTIVRQWTATDASGNHATCTQTITIDRPNLDDVDIPGDVKWTCEQYDAFPNIINATPLHPYITDTDGGTVIIDVNLNQACDDTDIASQDNPNINSTNIVNGGLGCPGNGLDDADVLALTGSGIPLVDGKPLTDICEIGYDYEDHTIEICPGTFKILRTWTLIDWCANPVDVREFIQVIKVTDEEAPTITAPADLTIDVYSASIPPNAGPHAVCNGTIVIPPATDITDNCSGVASYKTELWTAVGPSNNPQPGVQISSINTNGGLFNNVPLFINGLPAMYIVRYYATDGCGNQATDNMKITLRDKVPPVAVCDEITEVSITNNGLTTGTSCSTLHAESLDDGSYDNCRPVYFLLARMNASVSTTIYNRCYYPTVDFCCNNIGDNTVILLVLDGDPTPFFSNTNSPSLGCNGTPGLFLSPGFTALNYNTCMVTVQVTDKLPPILVSCPPPTRRTCDWYAQNLETQLSGLTAAQQCALLTPIFGEASFFDNCAVNINCSVSINIDQCLEGTISRTWTATDNAGNNGLQSCTQTINIDHVSDWVVEFPVDAIINCGTDVPDFGEPEIFYETCELVAVSYNDVLYTTVPDACYKIARTWTVINWCVVGANIDQEVAEQPENQLGLPFPTCDLDGDGDCDGRTFRDSWRSGGAPVENVRPTAASATRSTIPDTDIDSDPWDGYITYEQVIKVHDTVDPVFPNGCVIPDVCILDNTCVATVVLPQPDVDDCSTNVVLTASGQLGNGFGPFFNVSPGTYNVTYNAHDNCNNQKTCSSTITVKDCKKPTPYCKNGLVIELMVVDPAMVQVWATDFNAGSFDNCPGTLKISFSSNTNDIGRTYDCEDVGQQPVQMWVTDAAGNQDYCETFVIIQANMNQCDDDPQIAGNIATEDSEDVEGVSVNINSPNGFNDNLTTNISGAFGPVVVTAGGDYSISPVLDIEPLNGVTTFDLVLISKHILGITTLDTPYKMIAADANKSNSITTFDLVEIRKLILFINTDFPNNTSWRFVDKDFAFANPANPFSAAFPEVINLNNLSVAELAADFVAIKVGDVNGNASVNLLGDNEERNFTGELVLNTDDLNVTEGETYKVEFKATDFNVSGYQFTLNFDKKALELMDVTSGLADVSNFGLTMASEGVITTSWNSDAAKQLATGDVVFGLTFKAKQNGRLSDLVNVGSRYTVAEAYDRDNQLLNVGLSFNNTQVSGGFELYQNTPNPFASTTTIGFYLPEATSGTLTVSDVQGKVVKVINGDFTKGYNKVDLKRGELVASGVLYYRLDTKTDSATRKMILVD